MYLTFPQSKERTSWLSIEFSLQCRPFDFISHDYDLETWSFCSVILNFGFTLEYSRELNNANTGTHAPFLKGGGISHFSKLPWDSNSSPHHRTPPTHFLLLPPVHFPLLGEPSLPVSMSPLVFGLALHPSMAISRLDFLIVLWCPPEPPDSHCIIPVTLAVILHCSWWLTFMPTFPD